MTDPMTPPVPAEAVAHIEKAILGGFDTDTLNGRYAAHVLTFADLRALLAAYTDAAKALTRYGQHEELCDFYHHKACDCGFDAARTGEAR